MSKTDDKELVIVKPGQFISFGGDYITDGKDSYVKLLSETIVNAHGENEYGDRGYKNFTFSVCPDKKHYSDLHVALDVSFMGLRSDMVNSSDPNNQRFVDSKIFGEKLLEEIKKPEFKKDFCEYVELYEKIHLIEYKKKNVDSRFVVPQDLKDKFAEKENVILQKFKDMRQDLLLNSVNEHFDRDAQAMIKNASVQTIFKFPLVSKEKGKQEELFANLLSEASSVEKKWKLIDEDVYSITDSSGDTTGGVSLTYSIPAGKEFSEMRRITQNHFKKSFTYLSPVKEEHGKAFYFDGNGDRFYKFVPFKMEGKNEESISLCFIQKEPVDKNAPEMYIEGILLDGEMNRLFSLMQKNDFLKNFKIDITKTDKLQVKAIKSYRSYMAKVNGYKRSLKPIKVKNNDKNDEIKME